VRALRCAVHRDASAFAELRREWDELDAATTPRRPYASELWNRLWWQHFRRISPVVRDDLCIFTVRDDAGALIAIAPMLVTARPGVGAFARLRKLQFFGVNTPVYEIRGIVCRPEHQYLAIAALHDFFHTSFRDWDVLRWDGLRAGTIDASLALGSDVVRSGGTFSDYYLRLPSTWDELYARLSKNRKRKVRKVLAGTDPLNVSMSLASKEHAPASLQAFVELYRRQANSEAHVTARTDRLRNPSVVEFLLDYSLAAAERDALHLFRLTIGERPAAMQLAHAAGEDLYLCYSATDPVWMKRGVMTRLTVDLIKWSISRGYRGINLSTGYDLAKLRWRPEEIALQVLTQTRDDVRGRSVGLAYSLARYCRSSMKALSQRPPAMPLSSSQPAAGILADDAGPDRRPTPP
jgi:hypothetical protein